MWQQRELQKTLDLITKPTTLHVHFIFFFLTVLFRFCTTTTWKCQISRLMENVNKQWIFSLRSVASGLEETTARVVPVLASKIAMCRDRENWCEKRTGLSLFPRPSASYFNLNLFPRRPYHLRAWYRLCFVQYDFNFRSTTGHRWNRSEGQKRVGVVTELNFKPNCRMMIISSRKEVQSLSLCDSEL